MFALQGAAPEPSIDQPIPKPFVAGKGLGFKGLGV